MRQIVKAKDIQIYFGKKESMSFKMLSQIKKELGKEKHQPITISEFCKFYNVEKESIVEVIKTIEQGIYKSTSEKISLEIENTTEEIKPIPAIQKSEIYEFSRETW